MYKEQTVACACSLWQQCSKFIVDLQLYYTYSFCGMRAPLSSFLSRARRCNSSPTMYWLPKFALGVAESCIVQEAVQHRVATDHAGPRLISARPSSELSKLFFCESQYAFHLAELVL